MRRRDLILGVGGALVAPLVGRAQQPRRIGFLRLAPIDPTQLADFRAGLAEAGYAEGRNLLIEYRYAEGDYARLPELAADLVRHNVGVIAVSGGSDAVSAAMQATSTIPIVGTSVVPTMAPFSIVKHYNRPEGNVTGVNVTTGDLTPKRLQILTELVPGKAIGVLVNPTIANYRLNRDQIEKTGQALKVKLVILAVSADADLDPAFTNFAGQRIGAILADAEPFLGSSWRRLILLAERHKIPMMQEWREAVAGGGLISYAPSIQWILQQTGRYTGQLLNGAKVADLPVIAPTKIELTVNLKTAKALGLAVPQSLLSRADEVIE